HQERTKVTLQWWKNVPQERWTRVSVAAVQNEKHSVNRRFRQNGTNESRSTNHTSVATNLLPTSQIKQRKEGETGKGETEKGNGSSYYAL
ncbi:hypothetical protein BaRGS_00033954, partial [Batillaria attramentaria]